MRQGISFIVSGPSGGGKTTLAKSMLDRLDNLRFSVSCTTRTPRDGEIDGKDYRFISQEEFEQMVESGQFVEHALVHGNYYGTPVDEFENARTAGVDLLLDIDVQGASQIRKNYPNAVFCFVLPPSISILKERLVDRNSNGEIDINRRIERAKEEACPSILKEYDYIIINDELDKALEDMFSIIVSARCQSNRVIDIVNKSFSPD